MVVLMNQYSKLLATVTFLQVEMLKVNQPGNILKKLTKGLIYYQVPKQGQENTAKDLAQAKWAQIVPVSQAQRDGLIIPLSRMLSLDEMMTFQLIDDYFLQSPHNSSDFSFIQTREKELADASYRLHNYINPPNIPAIQNETRRQLEQRYQDFQLEHDRAFSKVINGAQIFYFQERKSLLDSLYFIVSVAPQFEDIKKSLFEMVKDNLYANLINSFNSSINVMQGELQYADKQKEIVMSLQKEEMLIYKILFGLTQNKFYPNKDNLLHFFNCQIQNEFKLNQSIIQDLTIIASLNMLSIKVIIGAASDNETKKNVSTALVDAEIQKIIQKIKIDARSTIVCIAYTELLKIISKQQKVKENTQANDSFFMEYLKEMVSGQVFTKEILAEQKQQFQSIIKDFLNLILPFLEKNKMIEEIIFAKTLQLFFLKNPNNLKETWNQDNELQLDMFKEELQNPLDHKVVFLKLMITVSGNKQHRYGHKVFKYLTGKVNAQEESLLMDLLRQLIVQLEQFESGQLEEPQVFIDMITLFSILIKQYPQMYEEFNEQILFLLKKDEMNNLSEIHTRGNMGYLEIELAEPMLAILMRSFHKLFQIDLIESIKPCKSILNAISAMYSTLNLQKEIILCFKANTAQNGNLLITEYVHLLLYQYECRLTTYKLTSSYLKLLQRIFENDFPQMCLHVTDRIHLDRSFLKEGLFEIYKNIMDDYYQFEFRDTGEFATFSKRLFKLTHALLSKFKDIPSQQKVQICQPYPKFNFLYSLIVHTLNQLNIEDILISTLDLVEKGKGPFTDLVLNTGEQRFVTNKFWLIIREKGTNICEQRSKLVQLIVASIRCLNVLMELVQINVQLMTTPSYENSAGVLYKSYYIQNLSCVQKLTQTTTDPSNNTPFIIMRKQSSITDLTFSLFNYISQYVNPDQQMQPKISSMQIEALKFFKISCQIWQNQAEKTRPQLYVHLQNNLYSSGTHTIEKFINTFIMSRNNMKSIKSIQFISGFFDLLIIACQSQHQFVEHVFKDITFQQQFKVFLRDLKGLEMQRGMKDQYEFTFVRDLCCKSVILISQMSTQRVCGDFLKVLITESLFKQLQSQILEGYLFEQFKQPINIDVIPEFFLGEGGDDDIFSIEGRLANNNNIGKRHFELCQSYTVAYYYMKLLQTEYALDSNSKDVKHAIAQLFQFKEIFDKKQNQDLEKSFQELWNYNEMFKNPIAERDRDIQHQVYSYVNTMGLFEGIDERDKVHNRLISLDGSVYLFCLDGIETFGYLQNVQPYLLIMIEPLNYRDIGKLGMNFVIPAEELHYLIKDQFYTDPDLIAQYKCAAYKYNLALSSKYINYTLTKAKMEFLLSIGKTKMRESIHMNIDNHLVITSSLYTIVGQGQEQLNEISAKNFQNKLIELMTDLGRAQYKQVLGLKAQINEISYENAIPINHFEVKQAEVDLELLSLILGVINSQTQLGDVKQGCIVALENLIVKDFMKNLPDILQQQFSQICIQYRQMQRAFKLESETLTANLFTQLVSQCFQLCLFLKQAKQIDSQQLSQENQLSREQISIQLEMQYLKILAQICALMQSGYCFQQCLSILSQSLSLLSPQNIKQFMENGQTQPLRVIVQRFINPTVSEDESIQIIKFFINYASIHKGAMHLFQENVLHNISINTCLLKVNQQEFYVTNSQNGESKRNPVHILWCLSLVLIRTLNDYLIGLPDYFKAITKSIKLFETRLSSVFGIGRQIFNQEKQFFGDNGFIADQAQHNVKISKILSLALFEEIELLTGALVQVFNHADKWAALNYGQYCLVKDLYLYSVCHLFSKQRLRCGFGTSPGSSTEQALNQIWPDKDQMEKEGNMSMKSDLVKWVEGAFREDLFNMTGFELKVELSKMKAYLNIQTSMLGVCLLNKEKSKGNELMMTWTALTTLLASPQRDASQSSITFTQNLQRNQDFESDTMLKIAFDNTFSSTECIFMIFSQLLRKKESFTRFIKQMSNFDGWINEEYLGLSQFLGCFDISEILQYYDYSLQIGTQVECLLIEKLIDVYDKNILDYQSSLNEPLIVGMCDSLLKLISNLDYDYGNVQVKDEQFKNIVKFLQTIKQRGQQLD